MQGLVSVFPALESRRRREETVTNGLIRDTWRVTRLLTVAHISAQSYKWRPHRLRRDHLTIRNLSSISPPDLISSPELNPLRFHGFQRSGLPSDRCNRGRPDSADGRSSFHGRRRRLRAICRCNCTLTNSGESLHCFGP